MIACAQIDFYNMNFVVEPRVVGVTRDGACARSNDGVVVALCFAILYNDFVEQSVCEAVLFEQILGQVDVNACRRRKLEGVDDIHDLAPSKSPLAVETLFLYKI